MAKFAENVKKGLKEAIEHAEGKLEVRTTVLAAIPPKRNKQEIKKLRMKLGCSQAVFARGLNVSVKTCQSWEQGTRKPSSLALELLAIAEKYPDIVLS